MTDPVAPKNARPRTRKRKKGDLLPNTRTIRECERRKWCVGAVEQTIPGTFIKRDFVGLFDQIAFDPAIGILGIQSTGEGPTSAGHHAEREAKIAGSAAAMKWLRSGGRIEVWSWAVRGARGAVKVWTLRRSRAFIVDNAIGWSEEEAS